MTTKRDYKKLDKHATTIKKIGWNRFAMIDFSSIQSNNPMKLIFHLGVIFYEFKSVFI